MWLLLSKEGNCWSKQEFLKILHSYLNFLMYWTPVISICSHSIYLLWKGRKKTVSSLPEKILVTIYTSHLKLGIGGSSLYTIRLMVEFQLSGKWHQYSRTIKVSSVGLHAGSVTIMQHMDNENQHLPKYLIKCQTFHKICASFKFTTLSVSKRSEIYWPAEQLLA